MTERDGPSLRGPALATGDASRAAALTGSALGWAPPPLGGQRAPTEAVSVPSKGRAPSPAWAALSRSKERWKSQVGLRGGAEIPDAIWAESTEARFVKIVLRPATMRMSTSSPRRQKPQHASAAPASGWRGGPSTS